MLSKLKNHRRRLPGPFLLEAGIRASLLMGAAFFLAPSLRAESAPPATIPVGAALEAVDPLGLNSIIRYYEQQGLSIGLVVADPLSEKLLYEWRGREPFIPASNMKLLTTATALDRLGPQFVFQTHLYGDRPIQQGVLDGNLYIKASGDPFFVDERLALWVQEIASKGLTRVTGDLVVDLSVFDDKAVADTWDRGGGDVKAHEALTGALSLNFNAFQVTARPSSTETDQLVVSVDPPTDYFRILNQARRSGKKNTLVVSMEVGSDGREEIRVSGRLPENSKGASIRLVVQSPYQYAATLLVERLRAANRFLLGGRIRNGYVADGAVEIAEFSSPPMSALVASTNKYSNNFMAEMLLKGLAAEATGRAGSTEAGLVQVRSYLEDIGLNPENYVLVDGSGLSRKNRITPHALAWLLVQAARHFPYAAEFESSLAIWGVDGTLDDSDSSGTYRVRAKTGYLNGVKSLSGYFMATRGPAQPLAFSLILNGPKFSYPALVQTVQAILRAVLDADWASRIEADGAIPAGPAVAPDSTHPPRPMRP